MAFDPDASIIFRDINGGRSFIFHTAMGVSYQSGVEVTNRSGAAGSGIGFIGGRSAASVSGTITIHGEGGGGIGGGDNDQDGLSIGSQAAALKSLEGRLITVKHFSITDKDQIVGTMESTTVSPSDEHTNEMKVQFTVKELLGVNADGSVVGLGTAPFFVPVSRIRLPQNQGTGGSSGGDLSGAGGRPCTPAKKYTVSAAKFVANTVKKHPGAALAAASPYLGLQYAQFKLASAAVHKITPGVKTAAAAVKAGYDNASEIQRYGALFAVSPLWAVGKVIKDAYFDKSERCPT